MPADISSTPPQSICVLRLSALAVLVALNIADELFRELEKEPGTRSEQVRQRVDGLVARLDEFLALS